MHLPQTVNTSLAIKFFAFRAAVAPDEWEKRFNWEAQAEDGSDGFTQAEMDAIYAEIIAKVPAGASRVLEIGCGDGRFGAALKAARPSIQYRGIDLNPDNFEQAESDNPSLSFEVGNAWEYLAQATMDWDFVVSIGCLFDWTEDAEEMFRLLDAKSPKGFFVLCQKGRMGDALLAAETAKVAADSANVAESYHEGARAFLDDATTLKGLLRPFYVHRDSTSRTIPEFIHPRKRVLEFGEANRVLARTHARNEVANGNPLPGTFKGINSTGGLASGVDSNRGVDPDKIGRIPKASPPSVPEP